MFIRLTAAAALAAFVLNSPAQAADKPAVPVREIMRLVMWNIAARDNVADGPFARPVLERLYSKSFAALYAAARANVEGTQAPFDRDPILDGRTQCPLDDVTLTVISPGAFHARVKVDFKKAWCVDFGEDASRRDRVTTTFFELANENNEWRVDDIRRDDFSFRDALKAAVPEPAPGKVAAVPGQGDPDFKTCVTEQSGFKKNGNAATFEVALTNTCEQPMRCQVSAHVITAGGPSSGKAVLILQGKSKADAAKKTYVLNVKFASGMANMSFNCKPM